ncbi:hypothetical protein ABXV22_08185 [Vibrio rotiferianus]|uniref:hypothetical protein n=1 Tax=Vibrio rotiferianus TaxID=190895 RepID=UPI0012E037F1|nr:hypothetical protein [Vibrio rotiferianus]
MYSHTGFVVSVLTRCPINEFYMFHQTEWNAVDGFIGGMTDKWMKTSCRRFLVIQSL